MLKLMAYVKGEADSGIATNEVFEQELSKLTPQELNAVYESTLETADKSLFGCLLNTAILQDKPEIISILLKNSVAQGEQAKNRMISAVMLAVKNNKVNPLKVLLAHMRAQKIWLRDATAAGLLCTAIQNEKPLFAKVSAEEKIEEPTGLISRVLVRHIQQQKYFYDFYYTLDKSQHSLPLHWAVSTGDIRLVQYLLKTAAPYTQLHTKDKMGRLPKDYCLKDSAMAKLLEKAESTADLFDYYLYIQREGNNEERGYFRSVMASLFFSVSLEKSSTDSANRAGSYSDKIKATLKEAAEKTKRLWFMETEHTRIVSGFLATINSVANQRRYILVQFNKFWHCYPKYCKDLITAILEAIDNVREEEECQSEPEGINEEIHDGKRLRKIESNSQAATLSLATMLDSSSGFFKPTTRLLEPSTSSASSSAMAGALITSTISGTAQPSAAVSEEKSSVNKEKSSGIDLDADDTEALDELEGSSTPMMSSSCSPSKSL